MLSPDSELLICSIQVSESFLPEKFSPMLIQSWSESGCIPPAVLSLASGMGSELLEGFMSWNHSGTVSERSIAQVSLKQVSAPQPTEHCSNNNNINNNNKNAVLLYFHSVHLYCIPQQPCPVTSAQRYTSLDHWMCLFLGERLIKLLTPM